MEYNKYGDNSLSLTDGLMLAHNYASAVCNKKCCEGDKITMDKRKEFDNDDIENSFGIKFDKEKLRYDLIPIKSLEEIAKVFGYGFKKYGAHNWEKGINFSRLYSATLRHLFAYWNGEDNDTDSGINHLSHAIVNLCMMLSLNNKWDDRSINGKDKF